MERKTGRSVFWQVYSRLPRREQDKARDALDRTYRRNLRRMDASIEKGMRIEYATRGMIDAMEAFMTRNPANQNRYRARVASQVTDEVMAHVLDVHGQAPEPIVVWPDEYLATWRPAGHVLELPH